MILVTGAAGKTGKAVLKALLKKGKTVRVMVHRQEQADELMSRGAADAVVGDMTVADSYRQAMNGVCSVYHICPNMHPAEIDIGQIAIDVACELRLSHFVYHSVLHPHVEKMPHHWLKMRVEEMLFESNLEFTILQPAPYMQNILSDRETLFNGKVFRVPYPPETRLSLVDLDDLAEAATLVLSEPGHRGAVYEIVGTGALTQIEVAGLIGKALGFEITTSEILLQDWKENAERNGLGKYQVETLLKMFNYYSNFGLYGSNYLLSQLLGRDPHDLIAFVSREFA